MYKLFAKIFGIKSAYRLSVHIAGILNRIPFARPLLKLFHNSPESMQTQVLDLVFESPVGLGPGLDTNGLLYDIYAARGFSYINIGPMDANGVKTAISHIQNNPPDTIISCCINADHFLAFTLAYDFVDMFVLEIDDNDIFEVLEQVLDVRLTYETYRPILLRISHEIPELETLVNFCRLNGVDGFAVQGADMVNKINTMCSGRVPIVGYGKIRTSEDAHSMRAAGASLIEVTTGFVLDGPAIVRKLQKGYFEEGD